MQAARIASSDIIAVPEHVFEHSHLSHLPTSSSYISSKQAHRLKWPQISPGSTLACRLELQADILIVPAPIFEISPNHHFLP